MGWESGDVLTEERPHVHLSDQDGAQETALLTGRAQTQGLWCRHRGRGRGES